MSKSKNPSTRVPTTSSKAPRSGKKVRRPRGDPSPRAKGIQGVPGSKNPERRCHATANRTGERCKKAAIKGGRVCPSHGGATKQAKKAARERLMEMVDPALAALHKILTDPNTDDPVKVRAALGILDRTGFGPGATLQLKDGRFEEMIAEAIGEGSHVELDRSLPRAPGEPLAILDAAGKEHTWEDIEQHASDMRDAAWRKYDEDDADATRRIYPTTNTVPGEVVARVAADDPPGYAEGS